MKAACCNLSESFETNPSVDVSFADAVTGTRQIQMLGLAGKYSLISRENMPNVRGLISNYGLTYTPGVWIQSIQVTKGIGSVANGYESITGQINVELHKPYDGDDDENDGRNPNYIATSPTGAAAGGGRNQRALLTGSESQRS